MSRKITLFIVAILIAAGNLALGQSVETSLGQAPQIQSTDTHWSNFGNLKNASSRGFCYDGAGPFQLNSQYMGSTTLTPIGATTPFGFPGAMAFVPATGLLYVVDQAPPFGLYTVDTTTGVNTFVVNCTGCPYINFTGLTWDGATMWGIGSDLSTSQIFTVNISTGVCTPVGFASGVCQGAIMINAAPNGGGLFSVDIVTDNLYKWNKVSGVATLVGSLGVDPNFGQDGHFDLSDGAYYWSAYTTGPELRIIDTLTGGSTIIGTYLNQTSTLGIINTLVVGMEEKTAETGISVYPNPNAGIFHISTEQIADEIQIFDILGTEVLYIQPESAQMMLDLGENAEGLYIARVRINNEISYSRIVLSR